MSDRDPTELCEPQDAAILLVDDNPTNLRVLYQALQGLGHRLLIARSGEEALRIASQVGPQVVLLDVMMPGLDGFETCRRLKADAATADASVIFISALGDTDSKVIGLGAGGVDYVTKPFNAEEVRARVGTQMRLKAMQRTLRARNDELAHQLSVARALVEEIQAGHRTSVIGTSPAAEALRGAIADAAGSDDAVLLLGPTSCDPEGVARLIHRSRAGGDRTWLSFAPLRGARASANALEQHMLLARGGTYYIECVNDLTVDWQAQLSALVQTLAGQPGAPRLICHSPVDLAQLPHGHGISSDLQLRLARRTIGLPPLIVRQADLPALAEHELDRIRRKLDRPVGALSPESLERMGQHTWPDNLRELRVVLERAAMLGTGSTLEVDAELLRGAGVVGGYQLQRRIGAGGMGEVWEAKHFLLARPAAVKLIRKDVIGSDDPLTLRRFRIEAQETARLRSRNTVELYDFGLDEAGAFYYVMELLEGIDLAQLIQTHGPLPLARVVHFLEQVCLSLAEAHERGLVHRDVKPANLFVCRFGQELDVVKVLDFGMVKRTQAVEDTSSKAMVGTPRFIAPEGLTGEPVDGRADLHSLGCVATYLLTGRHAYDAPTVAALIYAKTRAEPPDLSDRGLGDAVTALLSELLARDPGDRIPTAMALHARLEALPLEARWTRADAEAWWAAHGPRSAEG